MVIGTSWGVAIAHDPKRRNLQKWTQIRAQQSGRPQRGLTGAALEQAVMGIAKQYPGHVIHEVAQ